jgi:broad specificity phosphatase PhoE
VTTFFLIRHGEKDADDQRLSGRLPGIHLTARGRRQAQALARELADAPIRRVYCSPLERARETAAPIAEARRLGVEICDELHELNCGAWTGRGFAELASDPRWTQYNQFRSASRIPGGDTALEVQARVVGQLLRWRAMFPREGVAVVSHGDPIRFAVAYFLGMPLDFYLRLEIGVGSVTELTLDDHQPTVRRLNHLPPIEADEAEAPVSATAVDAQR